MVNAARKPVANIFARLQDAPLPILTETGGMLIGYAVAPNLALYERKDNPFSARLCRSLRCEATNLRAIAAGLAARPLPVPHGTAFPFP